MLHDLIRPRRERAVNQFQNTFETIWQAFSGDAAWQAVADLSRYHRIQASPGYRQAARWLHERLLADGLQAQILSYPADERARFWAWPSFQEWDCTAATLRLIEPEGQAGILADFRACPISVIQRSQAFEGEAGLVLLEDGEKEADYDGLDVAGKVVLSRGDLDRVRELAVETHGAIGILSDAMRAVPPVRPEGDLADVRQYTSFWWQPGDTRCFGFVLTPSQGRALRRLLKKEKATVRVQAQVVSALYDGEFEVVEASIPGEGPSPSKPGQEVVVVAHLCHPQPSANDNASGAAAALEAARTLQALIDSGALPRPRRTIRFLWLPEMTGTVAYLSGRETELDRIVAGINLDMVGEDQDQTGSTWFIERPPDAAASFTPTLLAYLRDQIPALKGMADVASNLTGMGGYPLYRQAESPFSGGSDHYILSDPSVGVPTPMLIQWPDRFYHTSADTPDRTDPRSLARAGALAAAYAYWLATAGAGEATWLGYEMVARFKTQLVEAAQVAVNGAGGLDEGRTLADSIVQLDRRLAYALGRQKAALRTLERLDPAQCLLPDWEAELERTARHELAWARACVELRATTLELSPLPNPPALMLSEEEQAAARLIPDRQVPGPVHLPHHMHRLDPEDRAAWRRLIQDHQDWSHRTLTALALYWADGDRSLLDIAGLVELETGLWDLSLLLAYFGLLEKLSFVSY